MAAKGRMADARHPAGPVPPGAELPGRLRLLLAPLLLVMLLSQLDNTIVGTAMPTVVGELGGREHMAWVVTAYTLATAAATPVWGRLGDMYGRKGVFMTAVALFLAGSALCGAAHDMGQLIAFRGVQGLGAGGLISGTVAVIGELVPPRGQGRYQGLVAGVVGTAMIAGPPVGGAVTDQFGWRWAFYVNVPLGAVALALIGALLHLPARRTKARADHLGAVLLMAGITAVVLVTSWGGTTYAWDSAAVLATAAAGAACLAAFAFWQTRAAEPLVPPRLLRRRNFPLMALIGFLTGFVLFGAALFLPLYQQAVRGASATASGLLLLPMPVAMTAVGVAAGRVVTVTGRYKPVLVAGGALLLGGMALLSRLTADTSRIEVALCVTVLGAGLGCLLQTVMLVSQNGAERRDIGIASASVTLFRLLGSSVGVAVMGGLFNGRVRQTTGPDLRHGAAEQFAAAGLQASFLAGAVAGAVLLVAALLVEEVPLRRS
ncbi:MDR family MFS transporter [Streptomyces cavernicola]|uniref:MDR family MFS transporter n=1 Tax=Streptomyces cavernicola TaxID=3043613 RepID=A0ABT6SKQ1_9ACTN|nr:MDR family MFS transporter [Streptomyces sp. B-S-A6]MDI3408232.1 MDR family MFS transporter [Streptomyces sp. B-S-A6]